MNTVERACIYGSLRDLIETLERQAGYSENEWEAGEASAFRFAAAEVQRIISQYGLDSDGEST